MAEMAREELKSMGPMSKAEWILALDFILLLFLWTVGDLVFHIPATISAFIGLVILLLTNIMSWKNIVAETTAWDTMFWFAVLVMMAMHLINTAQSLGFPPTFPHLWAISAGQWPLLF